MVGRQMNGPLIDHDRTIGLVNVLILEIVDTVGLHFQRRRTGPRLSGRTGLGRQGRQRKNSEQQYSGQAAKDSRHHSRHLNHEAETIHSRATTPSPPQPASTTRSRKRYLLREPLLWRRPAHRTLVRASVPAATSPGRPGASLRPSTTA